MGGLMKIDVRGTRSLRPQGGANSRATLRRGCRKERHAVTATEPAAPTRPPVGQGVAVAWARVVRLRQRERCRQEGEGLLVGRSQVRRTSAAAVRGSRSATVAAPSRYSPVQRTAGVIVRS